MKRILGTIYAFPSSCHFEIFLLICSQNFKQISKVAPGKKCTLIFEFKKIKPKSSKLLLKTIWNNKAHHHNSWV
jgi:hypothetical protein